MKSIIRCFLLVAFSLPVTAFGQGSLTPPGAPAPTMKTLDQIEARTPLAGGTAPITISASGSYYLTGNLTVDSGDAITVTARDVTLDLHGFTISTTATSPTGTAIVLSNKRVTVKGGFIETSGTVTGTTYTGGGFVNGINFPGAIPDGIVVRDVTITGCSGAGIKLGTFNSRVEQCSVENTGTSGITATVVVGCTSVLCGGPAITCSISRDNLGQGSGGGIAATTAENCQGTGLGSGVGLSAVTASNCKGSGDSGIGLQVTTGIDCAGDTNTGTAAVSGNVLVACQGTTTGSGYGILGNFSAANCYGTSHVGNGFQGFNATACSGVTDNSTAYGLYCSGTANGCSGRNTGSGQGALINLAIGCTASGSVSSSYQNKYLMP